ncbi:putative membrane protein DUF2207 [Microcella putealis]|uniref:Putative membrane protein DUF2207 n=2 Tax=Microcella putealis TaxID=337005 RepID=A0A4Q7LXA7_9MICO|nr:putative membrane protein DUF2207 [Microcella putealis]TQM24143.1 putative membrane protein DUF2207 [Microcella putealis]
MVALVAAVGAVLIGVAAPLGAAPGSAPAAHANVDNFTFDSFDVEYTLDRDAEGRATLTTVETLVARFPEFDQNRGIRRTLPASYQGRPTGLEVISVTDESGTPRPFEVESSDSVTSVVSAVPEGQFVRGVQTYVITYTQRDTVDAFTSTNAEESYWNLNGTDWAQPFGSVTGTVQLGEGLADALTGGAFCYQGVAGSTERCDIAIDGDVVTVSSTRALGPYENVTVAIGFTPGTFTLYDRSPTASIFFWMLMAAVLSALVVVARALWLRVTRFRDAPGRPVIVAEYVPPEGVDLVEAALLLHRRKRAIASEIIDLAVQGRIRIVEQDTGRGRSSWRLELVSILGASDYELRLMQFFFGVTLEPGSTHMLSAQSTTLNTTLARWLSEVSGDIERKRHWRRTVPARHAVLLSIGGFAAAGASFVFWVDLTEEGRDPGWAFIGVALCVVAAIVTTGVLSRRPLTVAGAEIHDHLEGLDEYIQLAEADRMRVLQSPEGALREPVDVTDRSQRLRLTERLLPWAVLFGHEKEWAEQLGTFYPEGDSPSWYRGTRPFSAAAFAAGVGSVSSTMSSSYSGTSSSGGSSGGGSSGGGGGGGGGGGV